MTVKLYQFCISHYSEKARWALDYKGVNYKPINLLPGQHARTITQMTRADSSVPVLDHDGQIVQGSAQIVDYLDQMFPDNPLTPADPILREQALEWEKKLDEQAGPAIRTWVYHYFLQRPKVVVPLLAAGTPFYNRILLSLAFSRVDEIMRKWMKINQKTADAAQQTPTAGHGTDRHLPPAALPGGRPVQPGRSGRRSPAGAAVPTAPVSGALAKTRPYSQTGTELAGRVAPQTRADRSPVPEASLRVLMCRKPPLSLT